MELVDQLSERIDLETLRKERINIAVFGHGNVGQELIDQIVAKRKDIALRRDIDLNIFAVANSTKALIVEKVDRHWRTKKDEQGVAYQIEDIIAYASDNKLSNLVAVDNTSSEDFVQLYPKLVAGGFHLISSNKIGNTISLEYYRNLRQLLIRNQKEYLYETNVGAGLPLVDTIRLLHLSGENITRIRGVFSGSLSYIFNRYSEENRPFSEVLKDAIKKGYTEPDPREDLAGKDVGRKLLILARELDLHKEFEDVSIENLIPGSLRKVSLDAFLKELKELDVPFHIKRNNVPKGHVLRYVADLHGDLSECDGGLLEVKLQAVPRQSVLGQLTGSDTIFEIYTESYVDNPIVIQGQEQEEWLPPEGFLETF